MMSASTRKKPSTIEIGDAFDSFDGVQQIRRQLQRYSPWRTVEEQNVAQLQQIIAMITTIHEKASASKQASGDCCIIGSGASIGTVCCF
jgi:hypothetical protein